MVPVEIVLAQVRAVVGDIGVDAVKVGMLGTVEVTLAVARALDELLPGIPVVVDPVMVAESGARLLQPDAQRALVEEILPRATVLTPNLPEARVLAAQPATAVADHVETGGENRADEDGPSGTRSWKGSLQRPRRSPARCWRWDRGSWCSPEAIARMPSICSWTAPAGPRWRSPGSATRTARRTARAAPTPPCWRRRSPWVRPRWRPRARPAGWRARR